MLRRIQHAEVDAALVPVDRRPALFRLLRANAVQFETGHAGRARHEKVLSAARDWLLEVLPFGIQLFLVLHRHWSGGVFEIWRFDLLPRCARSIRQPIRFFGSALGREGNYNSSRNTI